MKGQLEKKRALLINEISYKNLKSGTNSKKSAKKDLQINSPNHFIATTINRNNMRP